VVSLLTKGVASFLGLADAPHSYSGQSKKVARVNAGENALEFGSPPLGFAQFYSGGVPTDLPWAYESPLPWTPTFQQATAEVFFSPIMKIDGDDQVYLIDSGTAFWRYNITKKTFTKLASPAYSGEWCWRTLVPDSLTAPTRLYTIGDSEAGTGSKGRRVMVYTISSNSWDYSALCPYYDLRVNFQNKAGGNFSIGDTVTGATSGAQLKVTGISQNGSGYLDGAPLSEADFQVGEQISNGLGVTANVTTLWTPGGRYMLKAMVYRDANNIYIWAGRNDGTGYGNCNRGRCIRYDPTAGHFQVFGTADDYTTAGWLARCAAIKADNTVVYGGWMGGYTRRCKYTLATDSYSNADVGKKFGWAYSPNKLWYVSGANDQQGYIDTADDSMHDNQFAANPARVSGYGWCYGLSSDNAYIIALARSTEVRVMSVFGTGMWQLAQISPTQRVLLMVNKPNDGFPVYASMGSAFIPLPNYQTTLLESGAWNFFYSKAGDYTPIKLYYCFLEGG